jgi:hypothetical protein
MKIDIALHSSDSNPFYLDFWPLVSKIWKTKFHVEPLLLYIDNDHTIPIDETYGKVIKLKPVDDIPLYLQCLWIRYWYPSQVPEKVCMISDIDMFPLSRTYFIDQIAKVPDTSYVHLNPNHEFLPSCYHVAKGALFTKILDLEPTWEESIRALHSRNLGHDCFTGTNTILQGKLQWGADEEYATRKVRSYPDQSIFRFIPRTHGRIDRGNWVYSPAGMQRDHYADSHSIRPYSDPVNKKKIDELIGYIYRYCA